MLKKHYYFVLTILAVLALIATGYLVYERYAPTAEGTFCNFGTSFNCVLVNQSSYATLFKSLYLDIIPYYIGFDIPYSLLGVLTYLILIFLGILGFTKKNIGKINQKNIPKIILVLTGITTLFSLYLTYIEAFVLLTWCIFCAIQAILVTLMFSLTLHQKNKLLTR